MGVGLSQSKDTINFLICQSVTQPEIINTSSLPLPGSPAQATYECEVWRAASESFIFSIDQVRLNTSLGSQALQSEVSENCKTR